MARPREMVVAYFISLLCLLLAAAAGAEASHLEAVLGITPTGADGEQLEQQLEKLECARTLAGCQLVCKELELQASHHTPLQDVVVIDLIVYGIVAVLVVLACATSLQAARATQQLHAATAKFAAREAELLKRCKGIQAQAFDYAERLGSQPTTPDAGYRAPQPATTPNSLRASSPASFAAAGAHEHQQAYMDSQPRSCASTPPPPASESSAPNLALLVVEASPAKDTQRNPNDQLGSCLTGQHLPPSAASADAKSSRVPGQAAAAGGSPAARYPSAKSSPASAAPGSAASQHLLPGGPMAVPSARAGSPAAGSVASPPGSYYGPRPLPGSAQRAGMPAPPGQWTPQPPQHQPQQQQQHAMSCPPMPGGLTPYGPSSMAAPGPAPYSAGQLGAAGPSVMQQQPRGAEEMAQAGMAAMATPPPAGWVNASRGGGTPPPFPFNTPMSQQQHQQQPQQPLMSPGMGGYNSPAAVPGMHTPATASTTRTGSMTHVQSVASIAGSCGGSAPPFSSATPGSTRSTGSATSGARGSSRGSRTPPMDRTVTMALIGKLDQMKAAADQKKTLAQTNLAELKQRQGTPTASSSNSPMRESIV